jgi:dihydrolipoamide dehydrogenase
VSQASPAQHQFDLIVLGSGPGGYVAAVRAAQLGLKVAIVEKKHWGGVCLNLGCVPAKTLLRNAELADLLTREARTFGIAGEISMDYSVAVARSRKVADGRSKGIHYLMKKNAVTEFSGHGSFLDAHTVRVTGESDAETVDLAFDHAIIATGSQVKVPTGIELSDNVVTYDTLILEPTLPRSLIIIGAGAIGVEFAYLMRAYGVTVTVVEFLDRVLPLEDHDVSREIEKQYTKMGITVITSARVFSVVDQGQSVQVSYTDSGGQEAALTAEKVLISVGFAARVEGFGLENTGVQLTDRGAIAVDDHMRTTVDGICAIGDVTGKLQLAHVAEAQGIVAAEVIAGAPTLPISDYRMMPRAVFCQPQVASLGLTEEQARAGDREIVVATFPFSANAKAHALGNATGFVKLISDAEHGELIGAHLVGADVSELLPELVLAQKWEITAEELARTVHTHPTLSEGLQDAFHGLVGHMINL